MIDLYRSKLLKGRLQLQFSGKGGGLTCTVRGIFRDDLDTVCEVTTPPLRDVHPGRTQKDGRTYVRGSPLWDRDPKHQLAYFAVRRWIRHYAPEICIGMIDRKKP